MPWSGRARLGRLKIRVGRVAWVQRRPRKRPGRAPPAPTSNHPRLGERLVAVQLQPSAPHRLELGEKVVRRRDRSIGGCRGRLRRRGCLRLLARGLRRRRRPALRVDPGGAGRERRARCCSSGHQKASKRSAQRLQPRARPQIATQRDAVRRRRGCSGAAQRRGSKKEERRAISEPLGRSLRSQQRRAGTKTATEQRRRRS